MCRLFKSGASLSAFPLPPRPLITTSVSCVRGQIAALSHRQYRAQSLEPHTHRPHTGAVCKGQLYLSPAGRLHSRAIAAKLLRFTTDDINRLFAENQQLQMSMKLLISDILAPLHLHPFFLKI